MVVMMVFMQDVKNWRLLQKALSQKSIFLDIFMKRTGCIAMTSQFINESTCELRYRPTSLQLFLTCLGNLNIYKWNFLIIFIVL
ncbi:unnamed protein product [Blepharisma stoltei]|uniref:Uncharacterized protein n=1 Tax=Blepharisma stoltei TaxID=1481888 RepID=A0AAU9JT10_9CILI|nr:unnamed protein product [Blepharisma stoltei]